MKNRLEKSRQIRRLPQQPESGWTISRFAPWSSAKPSATEAGHLVDCAAITSDPASSRRQQRFAHIGAHCTRARSHSRSIARRLHVVVPFAVVESDHHHDRAVFRARSHSFLFVVCLEWSSNLFQVESTESSVPHCCHDWRCCPESFDESYLMTTNGFSTTNMLNMTRGSAIGNSTQSDALAEIQISLQPCFRFGWVLPPMTTRCVDVLVKRWK